MGLPCDVFQIAIMIYKCLNIIWKYRKDGIYARSTMAIFFNDSFFYIVRTECLERNHTISLYFRIIYREN